MNRTRREMRQRAIAKKMLEPTETVGKETEIMAEGRRSKSKKKGECSSVFHGVGRRRVGKRKDDEADRI
jgi:hypothetical protein